MVVGDVIADRYELEELVGTGGMSSVYRAHDRLLDRKVALKVLHPQYTDDEEYVERFRREARSVAQLSHPNIVTVIDRAEEDGSQLIVFEYVDGDNLKELVQRRGALPVEEAVSLAHQIARALAFAHEHGLVHRDIKPQNVLMNGDGRAKVTDFGIARSLDVKHGMTQTGTVLGTSDYIAPEQAQGQTISAQTDVYSLGIVLYELLTGEVPFSGENFVAVAMQHINEPPPSVRERRPEVPPRLDAAVQRAMAKDPDDRFSSMDAFEAELAAILQEQHRETDPDATMIAPRPPASRAPAGRPRVRRAPGPRRGGPPWIPLVLIGLLAAAAVAAAIVAWQRSHDDGSPNPPHVTAPPQVQLAGVTAYDPNGDGSEHNSEAPLATDGNANTFWTTSTYFDAPSLGKPGVGLVLDAQTNVKLAQLGFSTDTPGFRAEIRVGDSPQGPFRPDSAARTVGQQTRFTLNGAEGRYYLIWITQLGQGYRNAHVNEAKGA